MTHEDTYRELMLTYVTSQPANDHEFHEFHLASPLLDFLMTIATANDSSCQAVLDAGFLNMLLCMYTCNFGYSLAPHRSASCDRMLEACSDALLRLSECPGAATVISLHPVSSLWPKDELLSIQFQEEEGERAKAWRSLGEVQEDMVSRRLVSLSSALQYPVSNHRLPTPLYPYPLMDMCRDLIEFSRQVLLQFWL